MVGVMSLWPFNTWQRGNFTLFNNAQSSWMSDPENMSIKELPAPVSPCLATLSRYPAPGLSLRAEPFIRAAVKVWNSLPGGVVGDIHDIGIQSFKSRVYKHLMSLV